MIRLLSIAIKLLVFSFLFNFQAFSYGPTKLPVVSVVGNACDQEERISVSLRLEADSYAPRYCRSQFTLPDGRRFNSPHAYTIKAVTITDVFLQFSLDIDVQERLKDTIDKYHPRGISYEGSRISSLNYFKNCDFTLKEVNIYTEETSLVIRDSFYNRLENVFKIPQGTTRTADYSLSKATDRIRFRVQVLKKD